MGIGGRNLMQEGRFNRIHYFQNKKFIFYSAAQMKIQQAVSKENDARTLEQLVSKECRSEAEVIVKSS